MNRSFLSYFRVWSSPLRSNAFLLIVLCLSVQLVFGQTTVLTRAQFSRLTVVERARFFEQTISRIALEEQVDPYLLWTIAYNETRFRPWLVSPAGAEGLMQFIPATAARFNLFNPFQPEPAIRAAARYIRFLQKRFGGRIDSILAGYNAGEGAVDAYLLGKTIRNGKKIINSGGIRTVGGIPPFEETIQYVARGLVIYRILRERQIFFGAFMLSVYPSAVSERLARVWLRDPEIGFNGSLISQSQISSNKLNAKLVQQNALTSIQFNDKSNQVNTLPENNSSRKTSYLPANIAKPSTETDSVNSTNHSSTKEKPVSESNEVYYEPRTGARFQNRNGKIERLAESGELIVGSQLRASQPFSIRARGTFFGESRLTPK